jgi:hypothetical protein
MGTNVKKPLEKRLVKKKKIFAFKTKTGVTTVNLMKKNEN